MDIKERQVVKASEHADVLLSVKITFCYPWRGIFITW